VKDLAAPFAGNVLRRRRALVRHHRKNFPTEALLVKFKGGFAISVEIQIGVYLHRNLLLQEDRTGSPNPEARIMERRAILKSAHTVCAMYRETVGAQVP